MDLHLAQINIGTLRAPLDDPQIDDFRLGLDPVNAAADAAAGFVWRLQGDAGNATDIAAFDDPLTLVNMSVWTSREALHDFMYAGGHLDALRRRGEWFEPGAARTAMWWIPAGTVPTVADGTRRIAFLDAHGETPHAFGLRYPGPRLVLSRASLDHPAVQELIGELNAVLQAAYPGPGENHFTLHAHEVADDQGAFLLAQLDGSPVGCGAVRRIDATSAEIKRMYVRPSARGLQVGAAILDELEGIARGLGCTRLALETGEKQVAAVGLYRRAGFVPCPCWGEYLASAETSSCYEKLL